LNNNKTAERKGKVLLIDASQRYQKLRKNLGNKNCEFTPDHINEILQTNMAMQLVERQGEDGIAAQVFDNADFGYYKATIERPKRLKSQFSEERIETLRFDKSIVEAMQWAYSEFGDAVYQRIADYKDQILDWAEKNDLNLKSAQKVKLLKQDTWKKRKLLVDTAYLLFEVIGYEEFNDFNVFRKLVDVELKKLSIKLGATEKKAILNAVSWYDEQAEKVISKTFKMPDEMLEDLLEHLGCSQADLPDLGYFATGKPNEYIMYETESDLRDSENVPLKDDIHRYFLTEVKPHVDEAWVNLDATKIGYEISFNKYFYQHKPLRNIDAVAREILQLEEENEGLIMDILNVQ